MSTALQTLDVTQLPTRRLYESPEGKTLRVDHFFDHAVRKLVAFLIESGQVTDTASFGFAMAQPIHVSAIGDDIVGEIIPADVQEEVDPNSGFDFDDDPQQLIWFVYGWGPDKDRYIANAARKLRFSAREMVDSFDATQMLDLVGVKKVEDDGSFAWGDFPYGGAAFYDFDGFSLLGACSGLTQREDHHVTNMILAMVVNELNKLDNPDQ